MREGRGREGRRKKRKERRSTLVHATKYENKNQQ